MTVLSLKTKLQSPNVVVYSVSSFSTFPKPSGQYKKKTQTNHTEGMYSLYNLVVLILITIAHNRNTVVQGNRSHTPAVHLIHICNILWQEEERLKRKKPTKSSPPLSVPSWQIVTACSVQTCDFYSNN